MQQLKNISFVHYKRFIFSTTDSFLSPEKKPLTDINYYIQVPENIGGCLFEFFTPLIDLCMSQNKIWKNIYHRTQKEISSFLNSDGYKHEIKYSLTNNELKHFISLFNLFAKHKKIRKAEYTRLKAYNQSGILTVSYLKNNSHYICINFYRLTAQRASNIYSFNLKQINQAGFSNSYYGKAHRSLHWLDMIAFKNLGVATYDFCGWYNGSSDQTLLNINKFKEQFTKTIIKEYSGVVYTNRALVLMKRLKVFFTNRLL